MSDLNEAERVRRAENAKRVLEEFLDPAFERAHAIYGDRLKKIAAETPWEATKITALANAVRIVEEVHAQIAAFVYDGEDAKRQMIRADRIEKLSPARRRLLNIGSF